MKILNKLSTSDNIGNAIIIINCWDGERYKKKNKCDLLTPFGEGNGNPLQYSCLENPMDREAWQATVHGVIRVGHDLVIKPPPTPLSKDVAIGTSFFHLTL